MTIEADPFTAPEPEELAALFPGYAILSLIACGGMGAVYHARQVALDREVAIKILPREFSSDEAFREGFAAEAKAMAKLNHPNLIGVYDFGEAAGMLFIIMEFVPGQSLYHAAYQTAIEPKEAARLMSEICNGLAEAHRHGILHRDIKPANVLLDGHARPKIGDFGLARPIGTAAKEGEVIYGTPGYTAPEVLNYPNQVDARADVFSLGVVLHELLTGKLPSADTRPPSAISGCSPKFDAIVKKATQPVPALRYHDAGEMARDLTSLMAAPALGNPARAGMARPPSVRRPSAKRVVVKESSGFGMGWILILLALAGAGYWFFVRKPVPPPAKPPEEAPVQRETVKLPPIHKKIEEPKPDLPGAADDPTKPRMFDTPTAGNQFGTPRPEPVDAPKPEGPKPIYNIEAFFLRARAIMHNKATPDRLVRDKTFAENVEKFDRVLSRRARDEDASAVTAVSKAMREIRANGNRIPDSFKIEGLSDSAYAESFAAAIKRQEEADAAYMSALKIQAQTYVQGIQIQIKRLEETNDPGAVRILNEEVEATQADLKHFAEVIEK